ncbi:MAG: C40 family peptidase [Sulfurimonas sp.]|jgi:cell wall-associated NlpC family hydrolase|nr:C40 family peptidase [Sulfurimonas sp.]
MIKKYLILTILVLFQSHLYAKAHHVSKTTHPFLVIDKSAEVSKSKIIEKAQEYLGVSYGFGNKNELKTDCSGFTQQVFKEFGLSLPGSAALQSKYGSKVDLKDLQVGDLLFYRTYKREPSHVAIYAGNGQIIHASYRSKKVQYDDIDKRYYKQRFMYAKRLAFSEQNLSTKQN